MENKSEPGGEKDIEGKGDALGKLEQFTKEKKERLMDSGKKLVDDEIDKLDVKKQELKEKVDQDINEKKQELHEEKEKLDELKNKMVVEPADQAEEQIEKLKENESPELLVNKLGYNIQSQRIDTNAESVKELMGNKDLRSAINQPNKLGNPASLKAVGTLGDKAHEIGEKIGVTRIATDEEPEH